MAVYTHITNDDLHQFLNLYDVGAPLSCKGIAEGIENSNYLVVTDTGQFILTLYEKRVVPDDLPFFLSLMDHMAREGLPAARPVPDKSGHTLQRLCGRPAALIHFVPGISRMIPNADDCHALGKMLAKCHMATRNFSIERKNDLSLPGWHRLFTECGGGLDQISPGLTSLITNELENLDHGWPKPDASPLPRQVIHADLFPDNVLFSPDGKISGLIDFYFACTDYLVYDVAVCLNSWAFDENYIFNEQNAHRLLTGYQSVREFHDDEIAALSIMCRGAALRFLLTRAYDWLNQVPGAIVTVKDPAEYVQKLTFFCNHSVEIASLCRATKHTRVESTAKTTRSTHRQKMVTVYTDGACSGNPGPGGWGVYIERDDQKEELKGGETSTTNNRMELIAAIEGLKATQPDDNIHLYTDSQYVKNGLNDWIHGWKRNGWKTAAKKPVKNKDLWILLDEIAAQRTVEWHWVKGHAGNPGNERADALARAGIPV